MQIALCDDDKKYLDIIEGYLDAVKVKDLNYDAFENGEDLVHMYESGVADYDAVFLDMEMSGMNGIETANSIRRTDKHVIIVFITSYTKYMQESFKCTPFRFLVKPVGSDEFGNVFNKILEKISTERTTFVFTENRIPVRLFCDDIIYFESKSHWIMIYTKDKEYRICKTFTSLYESLNHDMFLKVHNSFIVNLNYIYTIEGSNLKLYNCNKVIPISRANRKAVISGMINFKERKYMV